MAAILIFALIDDLFIFYFRHYLNPAIKGGIDSLFEGHNLLASAYSRITLAASLMWIGKRTYEDLHVIRRIRNVFAHQTEVHSLNDEPVRGLVSSIHHRERGAVDALRTQLECPELTTRAPFLLRSAATVGHLTEELAVLRHAQLNQVDPSSLVGYDELPENLKDVFRAVSEFTLKVLKLP